MRCPAPILAGMVLSLLPTVSLSQAGRNANAGHELSYRDDEGYIVLSKILDEGFRANGNKLMNIRRLAITPRSLDQCTQVPADFQDAAADFKKKIGVKYAFEKKFSPSLKYKLVTIISTSIYYLSAVGFDKNKTHAIAYKNYFCGELCGQDGFYFLLKGKNGWESAPGITGCGRIS